MANLATVLREEIRRLARKEARTLNEKAHRASANYRRDIASMKRHLATLERKVALLEKKTWSHDRVAKVEVENVRFSAKGLSSQRKRLGISAAEYATLVGVSAQTLYNWERGRTRPRREQIAVLAALRGITKKEADARFEHLT